MLSIICASNNKKILDECLKKSLDRQTYRDFELIVVDTKKSKYTGASDALMSGAKNAKGDFFIFIHHDVVFNTEHELENVVKQIENTKDFGVLGIAGASYEKNILIGNITNGDNKIHISDKIIDEPTEVQTLDEVMFIIKRDNLEKYPLNLDNKTWHLYAVEYSLYMKEKNKKVMVIPCNIYHVSAGASLNNKYYKRLRKTCKEYKKRYRTINTTVGYWYTNRVVLELEIIKHKLVHKIVALVRSIKSKIK